MANLCMSPTHTNTYINVLYAIAQLCNEVTGSLALVLLPIEYVHAMFPVCVSHTYRNVDLANFVFPVYDPLLSL